MCRAGMKICNAAGKVWRKLVLEILENVMWIELHLTNNQTFQLVNGNLNLGLFLD